MKNSVIGPIIGPILAGTRANWIDASYLEPFWKVGVTYSHGHRYRRVDLCRAPCGIDTSSAIALCAVEFVSGPYKAVFRRGVTKESNSSLLSSLLKFEI